MEESFTRYMQTRDNVSNGISDSPLPERHNLGNMSVENLMKRKDFAPEEHMLHFIGFQTNLNIIVSSYRYSSL